MIKEFQGEYRWLSNFWPARIPYKGRIFHNIENTYHSEKNDEPKWKDFCANEENPRIVKPEALKVALREDWEKVKINIMKDLLLIKFHQEPFKTQLIETGDQILQEGNSWGDIFWGVDLETGEGQNIFGKMLMDIRRELKGEK